MQSILESGKKVSTVVVKPCSNSSIWSTINRSQYFVMDNKRYTVVAQW